MMSFSFLNRKMPLPWDFAAYVRHENVHVQNHSNIKSLQLNSAGKKKKLTHGLHDPGAAGGSFELLHKDVIFTR